MDINDFLTIWFVIMLSVVLLSISYLIIKTANNQVSGLNTYRIETIREER